MDLRGYLDAIRKGWWITLLAILFGLGTAALLTARADPLYESTVTFFVSTPSDSAGTPVQANQFAQQRVVSYGALLTSDMLARRVLATVKPAIHLSVSDVSSEIVSSVELNTVLLTATVTDHSPSRSLAIATAVAHQFDPMIAELDNRSSSKAPTVILNVTSGPTLNPVPVSPRKTLNLLIGILVGLFLGVALSVVRELLNTSVNSAAVLQGLSKHPILGQIGFDPSAKKVPVMVGDRSRSPRAEALRQLRTNLQFVHLDSPVQVLVVTSSVANEGKSTTATNLSIVFAETGKRVVLIEADLRRPRIADYLGLERSVGLTNVLVGQADVDDVLQPWGDTGLMILPSGSIPPNPSELLGSAAMAGLVARLRESYDMIILDTPPVLPVTDAAVAAAHGDGVILVVRFGRTKRSHVTSALLALDAVDSNVLGCVFNMVSTKGSSRTSVYDGYGYYEIPSDSPSTSTLPKPASALTAATKPESPNAQAELNPSA